MCSCTVFSIRYSEIGNQNIVGISLFDKGDGRVNSPKRFFYFIPTPDTDLRLEVQDVPKTEGG